jgi:hypothetical protein
MQLITLRLHGSPRNTSYLIRFSRSLVLAGASGSLDHIIACTRGLAPCSFHLQTSRCDDTVNSTPFQSIVMRMRLAFAVAAVSVAGAVILASWPSPCPIELKMVSVQPAEMIDEQSKMLRLLTLSLRNPNSVGLRFQNKPIVFEERVANRWIEAPNRWTLGGLGPAMTSEELFLIAPGTDACRFRLKYCYSPGRLPLGIGDYWARVYPPTPLSARVQRLVKGVSANLYDRLWPNQPSVQGPYWKPHWRVGCTHVCNVTPNAVAGEQTQPTDNR